MILRNVCMTTPFVVVVVSFAVMLGWFLHVDLLVSVLPKSVPMQFNTSVCFLLSGIALLLLTYKASWLPYAIAIQFPSGIIGFLTLVQYSANVDLGIDELFMDHYFVDQEAYPGRMAPNTALCFSLLLTHLLCFGKNAVAFLSATFVLFLGSLALTGYILDISELYFWGYRFTAMAVHTGFLFAVLGGSLLLCIRKYF